MGIGCVPSTPRRSRETRSGEIKIRPSRRELATVVRIAAACVALAACAPPTPTAAPRPVSASPRLVPAPASLILIDGAPFDINRNTGISVDANPEAAQVGEALATMLRTPIGFPFLVTS